MNNARITYFGSGTLSLQLRRFPSGRELVGRLDDILEPERHRHRDYLLVVGMDGRLINVGRFVPKEAVVKATMESHVIDDNHTGFMVVPPEGYGIMDEGPYLTLTPRIDIAALKAKIDADGPMEVRMPLTKVVPENVVPVEPPPETKFLEEIEAVENAARSGLAQPLNVTNTSGSAAPAAQESKSEGKKRRGKRSKDDEGVPQDLLEVL